MAIPPSLAKFGISAGSALLKYGVGSLLAPKRKPFGRTKYGRHLKTISQRGVITPEREADVLSGVASEAGGVASRAKAAYRGTMANLGASDSIAGAGKVADIDRSVMDKLAEAKRKLGVVDAESKQEAALQYAKESTAWNQRNRQEKQDYNRQLLGKLGGELINAGTSYATRALGKASYVDNKGTLQANNLLTDFKSGRISADVVMASLLQSGMEFKDIQGFIAQLSTKRE